MKYETTNDPNNWWLNNNPAPWHNTMQNWPDWSSHPLLVANPVGWQCPVCGQVYAPTVMTCFKKHRKPRKPKADGEAS